MLPRMSEAIDINSFVRRHFVHLISMVALLAYLTPSVSCTIRAHRLAGDLLDASTLSLVLMVSSAALQCSLGAFRSVLSRPRALLACLAQLFVFLPLTCWLLGRLCVPLLGREVGQPLEIGLHLVVLMPVTASAAIWVRDSDGDIELLMSLVVITMAVGALAAPLYLHCMSDAETNPIVVPRLMIQRQLVIGVLAPFLVGCGLNRLFREQMRRIRPCSSFIGSMGVFLAVYLNVGAAFPVLRRLSAPQIAWATMIVLMVNVSNFVLGSLIGHLTGLERDQQVTCEFSSGMRSNGTALVVGLGAFPSTPLVTVPAAICIVFQHLVASIVKARWAPRGRPFPVPVQRPRGVLNHPRTVP
jgi:predicted Na+-dependent transporter